MRTTNVSLNPQQGLLSSSPSHPRVPTGSPTAVLQSLSKSWILKTFNWEHQVLLKLNFSPPVTPFWPLRSFREPYQPISFSYMRQRERSDLDLRFLASYHYLCCWGSKQLQNSHHVRAAKMQNTRQGLKPKSSDHTFAISSPSYFPPVFSPFCFLFLPVYPSASSHWSSLWVADHCSGTSWASRSRPWANVIVYHTLSRFCSKHCCYFPLPLLFQ